MKNVIVFFLIFTFKVSFVYAEDSQKVTKLSFEDELIKGDVDSPDLLLILKTKNPSYGRLLKLRDHFLPELRATRHEVLKGAE